MRILALLLAGSAASALPSPALAQDHTVNVGIDAARLATAREIVGVVLPPGQRQQIMASFLRIMMRNMVGGLVDGTPGLKDELSSNARVKDVFDRFVARQQSLGEADLNQALPGLVEAYARAYARTFSADELTSIKAFVLTPAGAKFLQRGPELLADPDVSAWQRRVTEQGAARQQTELATLMQELKAARAGSPQ